MHIRTRGIPKKRTVAITFQPADVMLKLPRSFIRPQRLIHKRKYSLTILTIRSFRASLHTGMSLRSKL